MLLKIVGCRLAGDNHGGRQGVPINISMPRLPLESLRDAAFGGSPAYEHGFQGLSERSISVKKLLALPSGQCYPFFNLPPAGHILG
jgi:hypothetical protein